MLLFRTFSALCKLAPANQGRRPFASLSGLPLAIIFRAFGAALREARRSWLLYFAPLALRDAKRVAPGYYISRLWRCAARSASLLAIIFRAFGAALREARRSWLLYFAPLALREAKRVAPGYYISRLWRCAARSASLLAIIFRAFGAALREARRSWLLYFAPLALREARRPWLLYFRAFGAARSASPVANIFRAVGAALALTNILISETLLLDLWAEDFNH
jgi:hypothetical protein